MGLLIKMEVDIEVKATAEQFYHVFRTRPHHLPDICSDIDAGEIHDGEWHAHGSTRFWTYKSGGKSEKFKEKIEFDDAKKKVTHVGIEGDVFQYYKSYKAIWEAVPKPGGEGAIVKVAIEYEKVNKEAPSPDNYLEVMVGFTKDIDAHLTKA
ncbi:hypothetical protein MLD38_005414 [Melastoma candidum]|uniref:Uncharacterized protein n=1 Tax=Melastoma candidum TaxID=119954 RepID=A0ACB9RJL1_9MYRT|nr:hypothetical protein MLD38_005414 [Melastoma candidum]